MKPWVDYDLVKRSVGMGAILLRYNIHLKQSGTELRGPCPLPQHGAAEKHKSRQSFMVNLGKGIGGAWACESSPCIAARGGKKGGNCIDFVQHMERLSTFQDAAIQIQQWFNLHPARPSADTPHTVTAPGLNLARTESNDSGELAPQETKGEPLAPNPPLKFALKGIDPHHAYLKARDVSNETAETFGVGFFPGKGMMSSRVVIPIHNRAGELVAYAGRSLEDQADKYRFPPGFHKSLELYNTHRVLAQTWQDEWADLIVIVEGFFDAMKLWQAGVPAVALMGSSLSPAQADLIHAHWYDAVLMLDGDDAGRSCTDQSLALLGRHMWVRAIMLDDGVQPDQLSPDQVNQLLESAL